jgi:16S rRNA (guanine527-N7)-methyltransferase
VTAGDDPLVAALERARERGYFGPGPVLAHLRHARGYAVVAGDTLGAPPARAVDLGTGGGVPGLVLAHDWPATAWLLVESGRRRSADLEAAVRELGLEPRVVVRAERAEIVGREPRWREAAGLVTARSFGPPALTAEIATGLVAPGGLLIVSEPPDPAPDRWSRAGLEALGFGPPALHTVGGATYAAVHKVATAPPGVPRATKALVKRPAW